MNRLLCGAAVLVASVFASGVLIGADEKKADDTPKAKGQLPANWKQLGLSKEQTQDVYKIQTKYTNEIDKLKAKIEALKAEEKAELDKILTDDQRKKLREIRTGEKPKDSKDKEKSKDPDK